MTSKNFDKLFRNMLRNFTEKPKPQTQQRVFAAVWLSRINRIESERTNVVQPVKNLEYILANMPVNEN